MSESPAPKPARPRHRHAHDHGCGHTSLSFEELVVTVRDAGLRMTESRRAILRTLLAARAPLTLEEIRDRSRHEDQLPDFATVFRTMEKLEELRLVHRVNLERASSYFELLDPGSHHEHLICVGCGLVKPITDECPVEKMERALAKKHGFTEIRHSLEFFGRCPACSATPAAPAAAS